MKDEVYVEIQLKSDEDYDLALELLRFLRRRLEEEA